MTLGSVHVQTMCGTSQARESAWRPMGVVRLLYRRVREIVNSRAEVPRRGAEHLGIHRFPDDGSNFLWTCRYVYCGY